MRRYLVFPGDFDARALTLEEPGEHWDEVPKKLHAENRQRLLQHLQYELGPMNFEGMRHKAIHFNPATVTNLRSEALSALRCLADIITKQFGFAGGQKWLLPGTRGNFFIKKRCETDPFLQTYYLPQCPYVGPYYAMKCTEKGWYVFDRDSYPNDEISDEEFARLYESRTPDMLVSSELPPREGVRLVAPGKH